MTRYILIDRESGYIWHDINADSPDAACRATDDEVGSVPSSECDYWNTYSTDSDATYDVYEAPADFPAITDGQDEEQITAVTERCEHVATIAVSWNDPTVADDEDAA